MSDSSAKSVASLRSRTGVSILECKKALDEAGGDEEKAIDLLRKRGIAQAAKKAEREQSEGLIFSSRKDNKVVLIEVKCETDFVARDENFSKMGQDLADAAIEGEEAAKKKSEEIVPDMVQKLGENIALGEVKNAEGDIVGTYVHTIKKIGVVVVLDGGDETKAKDVAMHAAAMNPNYVSPDDVSNEDVDAEKEIWKEQLAAEGKPAEIMEKIMGGKEKKFREENALITQEFVKDPSMTIEKYLDGAKVTTYIRLSIGL